MCTSHLRRKAQHPKRVDRTRVRLKADHQSDHHRAGFLRIAATRQDEGEAGDWKSCGGGGCRTWQFDLARRQVRPVVAAVLAVFREFGLPLRAVEVASWVKKSRPEPEELTPADWIAAGWPDEPVVAAARHSAANLAA